VHGGLSVLIDSIRIISEFKRHLYRFVNFAFRSCVFAGERVPTPDATISGVVPSSFGIFGSAPRLASRRINSASPVRAASRNGDPPIVFSS
jgi:hypothetical protein